MSTQNQRPESELDLSQFGTGTTRSRDRIHWIRLTDAVQPIADSDADFDREQDSVTTESHTDSYDKCPLCVNTIADTPLPDHLLECPVRTEVPR